MDFGLSYKDWSRVAWTFFQGAVGFALVAALDWVPGEAFDVRALIVGAAAAGISLVKNFALADSSPVK